MTLGWRLTAWLDAQRADANVVAARLITHLPSRGGGLDLDDARARLAALKADDAVALRFFFAEPENARALLSALDVPEPQRAAWWDDAAVQLEDRPVRFAVDLSELSLEEFRRWGEALSQQILEPAPPLVALLVTPSQSLHLNPRHAPRPRVRVITVSDAAEGHARALRFALEGVAVASRRRVDPVERWIAIDESSRGPLHIEPPLAVERLAAGLPLDELPAVENLMLLTDDDVEPMEAPSQFTAKPPALRRTLADLILGRPIVAPHRLFTASQNAAAATRRAWARSLRVPVALAKDEWSALMVERARALGLKHLVHGGEVTLVAQRAAAARGGATPRGVVTDGRLHLIGASAEMKEAFANRPQVEIHEVEREPSGLDSVRELAASRDAEGWYDDPTLEGALAARSPTPQEQREAEFAWAALLLNGGLTPRPGSARQRWHHDLEDALLHDPPAVGLRVSPRLGEPTRGEVLLPSRVVEARRARGVAELLGVPALVPSRITRDDGLVALRAQYSATADLRELGSARPNPSQRPLLSEKLPIDDAERMLELLDRSTQQASETVSWRETGEWLRGWSERRVVIRPETWEEADVAAAMAWLALRHASQGETLTMHDGRGILALSDRVVAVVTSRTCAHAPERLELDLACDDFEWERGHPSVVSPAAPFTSRRDGAPTGLPAELVISHAGVRLRVVFRTRA